MAAGPLHYAKPARARGPRPAALVVPGAAWSGLEPQAAAHAPQVDRCGDQRLFWAIHFPRNEAGPGGAGRACHYALLPRPSRAEGSVEPEIDNAIS